MERINFYELILYNGHESDRCLRKKFLQQKINSTQIKVCLFQWTPSLSAIICLKNLRTSVRRINMCFVYANICLVNLIIYIRKIYIRFIDGNICFKV